MTSKFKAVIFDMDGLLVDSETVWEIAETEMIESRGKVYSEEVRQQIIGMRLDEFMVKLHDIYKFKDTPQTLTAELIDRMLKLIAQKVDAKPGAQEIIEYVIAQDIPCAVASSSPMAIIDAVIASQGWDTAFANRFSADDDTHGKPAPDVYLRAAGSLGYDPAECLALEDSPNGARAAVAAGMTCYAVPDTSHSTPDQLKAITPHVFNDLHEVLATLSQQ